MKPLRSLQAFMALAFGGCAARLEPAAHVDLPRYMGSWRVIAVTDNATERNFVDAVENYSHRGDGKIDVLFRWRERAFTAPEKTHRFTGRVVDRKTNSEWKMNLFPLFSARYVIVAVDDDYQWAVVAHPSRKFGWILARKSTLPEAKYQELLKILGGQGYDISIFRKVPQPRSPGDPN